MKLTHLKITHYLGAWARDGKIIPAPVKIGRAYFVEAKAMHVEEVIRGGVMG
jgi:hypothetical protein